jgi:hypothetical protein
MLSVRVIGREILDSVHNFRMTQVGSRHADDLAVDQLLFEFTTGHLLEIGERHERDGAHTNQFHEKRAEELR